MGIYSNIIKENNIEYSDIFDISEEGQELDTFIEEEYLSLCELQGLEELSYFEKNRKEIPFNEADESLGKRIINLFNNIWTHIQQYINKFMVYLDNFGKDNRRIVAIHRDEINSMDLKNFSYKGYNYTLSDHISYGFTNKILWMSYSGDNDIHGYKSMLYGRILKKNISYSDKEFKDELFKVFRDGQDQKVDVRIDRDKIMKEISDPKYNKNRVNMLNKKCKEEINNAIKETEKNINKSKGEGHDPINHRILLQVYKMSFSVLNVYIKNYITAINDYNHQNKDILIKMLEYNRMNKHK